MTYGSESPAVFVVNHNTFLSVRANKVAKWKIGLKTAVEIEICERTTMGGGYHQKYNACGMNRHKVK